MIFMQRPYRYRFEEREERDHGKDAYSLLQRRRKNGAVCKGIREKIRSGHIREEVYTKADINWRNPLSRCNREHLGNKEVPVSGKIENFADYDTVCIGFPIWYGCAPNVVHTFCKDYDWTGKKVYVFATSGGGGIGKTEEKIRPHLKGANILDVREYKAAEDPAAWEKK